MVIFIYIFFLIEKPFRLNVSVLIFFLFFLPSCISLKTLKWIMMSDMTLCEMTFNFHAPMMGVNLCCDWLSFGVDDVRCLIFPQVRQALSVSITALFVSVCIYLRFFIMGQVAHLFQ